MDFAKKYAKIILNIMIPMITIYLIAVWGPRLLKFFLPFVIGWLIAMIANPLVRFLEKRVKILRKHSSVIIVVSVLILIIGVLYLLIAKLVMESIQFAKDLPLLYGLALVEIREALLQLSNLLRLPQGIQDFMNTFTNNLGTYMSLLVQKLASPTVIVAGNVARGIPKALVYAIITILSSYFFIAERDRIMEFIKCYMPKGGSRYYLFLKKDIKHLIGGYFLAQFRIMFVVAAILTVGFFVLGINYALLLAILISVLDFLPLFGTGTALIPWAIVKLMSGEPIFAVGLILLYILTQVVRQIIQPKIVGDTMGLPPLLTLLFLYLGFKLHGISGMILAVPIGIFALNLYRYGAFNTLITNVKTLVHDIDEFRKRE